jgi:AraC-like DNA-binding protein
MSLLVHKPAAPLSQYVEFMWRAANSGALPSRQRVYPNGAMALVIHLKKPTVTYFIDNEPCTFRVPLLAGPYSRSFEIDPSQSTAVIGILFRPGVGRMFFPIAPHELHNADIALSELCPGAADRLLNDVCSAPGEHAQFLVVEQYLIRKLGNAAPIHPAVRYGVEQLSLEGGIRSVRKIQLDTGLSHTRFIQLFREHVGLTPKLFCRVRRFHALLDQITQGRHVNWAELAADCGYFDQAHLIRDFRAFAGITPLEYSRAMPDSAVRSLAAATES